MTPGEKLHAELLREMPAAYGFTAWRHSHATTRAALERVAERFDIKAPPRVPGWYWVCVCAPGCDAVVSFWEGDRWRGMGTSFVIECLAGPLEPPK